MRVLFVGFALPEADFQRLAARDAAMPTQTQRFGWSVIEAMQSAGIGVDVVSAAPASDYPHNPRWWFRGGPFHERGVAGRSVSFINVTGAKHLSRYLTATLAARRVSRRSRPDAIVVHGVHSPFIWLGVRLSRRYDVPVVVVLTDPPSLPTPYDGRLSGRLKTIDKSVILAGLRRVTGVAALTPFLAADFAPGRPVLQFEGIARPQPAVDRPRTYGEDDAPRVVYAGGLNASYGVRALVESVAVSQGSWRLHLYGAGEMADEVAAAAAENARIVFHGLADSAGIATAYADAALLVNPRPTSEYFVRYSFPSKLVEYLSSGRPVMTTRLPTIPPDYVEHLAFCGETAGELAVAIDSWFEEADGGPERAAAASFILQSRGLTAQGARLRDFLSSLRTRVDRAD